GQCAISVAQGEIIGDRDRLVMGDEEAELRPGCRAPAAHPRRRAGPVEIDGGAAAVLVFVGVLRHPAFMRAPAKLGWLQALGDESLDRPGVPEGAERTRLARDLGVALGDMDALDAETLHEARPAGAVMGFGNLAA